MRTGTTRWLPHTNRLSGASYGVISRVPDCAWSELFAMSRALGG